MLKNCVLHSPEKQTKMRNFFNAFSPTKMFAILADKELVFKEFCFVMFLCCTEVLFFCGTFLERQHNVNIFLSFEFVNYIYNYSFSQHFFLASWNSPFLLEDNQNGTSVTTERNHPPLLKFCGFPPTTENHKMCVLFKGGRYWRYLYGVL